MTDVLESFCRALWKQDVGTIGRLLLRVDPNGTNRWGQRPLLLAACYADAAVVGALLHRGADVDQSRHWLTPLACAAKRRAEVIMDLLLRAGAQPSPVVEACSGAIADLRARLRRDPEVSTDCDEEGTPLLHHAAEAMGTAAIDLLMRHGAKIDASDATGETALHRIADLRPGVDPIAIAGAVDSLIGHGATVDARNRDMVTPLHQAVRARNLVVTRLLLMHGADPNARDRSHGSTPLRRAVCSTGASGTAGSNDGLMADLTRLLLAHGANPRLRDRASKSMIAPARSPAVLAALAEIGVGMPKSATRKPTRARVRKH